MARPALQDSARTCIAPPPTMLGVVVACAMAVTLGAVDVLERSYNPFRTGANTAERILTPANVRSSANQFHKAHPSTRLAFRWPAARMTSSMSPRCTTRRASRPESKGVVQAMSRRRASRSLAERSSVPFRTATRHRLTGTTCKCASGRPDSVARQVEGTIAGEDGAR